jgi:hypothetical protein
VSVDGNRFELWTPANQTSRVALVAKNSSGMAWRAISQYQLRQAAIDGVNLRLSPPATTVKIKVTDQGKPAAGAKVRANLVYNVDLSADADREGIARIDLLADQEFVGLTAWTEDHRVGGFQFDRKPPRDPNLDEYQIELSKCRDAKLRFVDEHEAPVPAVEFQIQVATPAPNYNFLGVNDHSHMTTDSNGEAVYSWFPDWEQVHFYVDVESDRWVVEDRHPKPTDDGFVVRLKQRRPRKQITGHVKPPEGQSPAGFLANLYSFQGERQHYPDSLHAIADANGYFQMDVLPGSTYCAYILDERWVSEISRIAPYDGTTNQAIEPKLIVREGQPVNVTVTEGPADQPVPHLSVSFRREYEFSWSEDGKPQSGSAGPHWWVQTDETGIASTFSLPGKMIVSVYTPRWRTEKTITVAPGKPAEITLHRDTDEARLVIGRVFNPPGVAAELKGVEITMGSFDPNYEDEQSTTCDQDGRFSLKTQANSFGVFASTKDKSAAGSTIVNKETASIAIQLEPTSQLPGRLLDKDGKPIPNRRVYSLLRLENDPSVRALYSRFFELGGVEAKTDGEGNFVLQTMPVHVHGSLFADNPSDPEGSSYLGSFDVQPKAPDEKIMYFLEKRSLPSAPASLAERYQNALRDCSLNGFRLMLIIAGDNSTSADFVGQNFVDYNANQDVYPFMQVVVRGGGQTPLPADEQALLQQNNWPTPRLNHVTAIVIGGDGQELDRREFDVTQESAAATAREFVKRMAPEPHDAEVEWRKAFAEAAKTNRKVWARVSERYCGPCLLMTRWLDDQRELLAKDYVMLKIDDVWDTHGREVAQRIVQGKSVGIPFHAILDAPDSILIDSMGPHGNIGRGSGPEGQTHLRKMMRQTRRDLTEDQIEQIIISVGE